MVKEHYYEDDACFNTQPRGGGCDQWQTALSRDLVSTHSRAEAAAGQIRDIFYPTVVSTHSRAEAAA